MITASIRIGKYAQAALLFSTALLSCNGDPPNRPTSQNPEIKQIIKPARVFLADDPGDAFHVVVSDPQGVADIARVALLIRPPGAQNATELAMRDDGRDGDILAGDGQYFVRVPGSTWQTAGTGGVAARVDDQAGNSASSEFAEIEVAAGNRGIAPTVSISAFPDSINIDTSFTVSLLVSVDDRSGNAIDEARFSIFPPLSPAATLEGDLLDDGQSDDGVAGNGIYGARFENRLLGSQVGRYSLRVQATDGAGNASRAAVQTFIVTSDRVNLPPFIVSVTAPDTISRTQTNRLIVRAVVDDPNGLADIERVFFNSFLPPDGRPSSGNPFVMCDTGPVATPPECAADAAAGDGEYTFMVPITASIATGQYRFEFQAQDKAGLLSEKVIHRFVVVE